MTLEMTLQELHQYNGVQNIKIYIACQNIIFDVTESEFYKQDGGYGLFAGHDCSINLGKMKFDQEYLDQYGKIELDAKERETLQQWVDKFSQKYNIIGKIK